MALSLESYCVTKVVLAKAIMNDPDPRLRRAYDELKALFVDQNRRAIEATSLPALVRRQAE